MNKQSTMNREYCELDRAARLIHKHCKSQINCDECFMCDNCLSTHEKPCTWVIKDVEYEALRKETSQNKVVSKAEECDMAVVFERTIS
jgi:hypothetical protein